MKLSAHLLGKQGLSKGDRVLLVFEPSLQYLTAFIACVRVGLIAVPVFPPGQYWKLGGAFACYFVDALDGIDVGARSSQAEEGHVHVCGDHEHVWGKDCPHQLHVLLLQASGGPEEDGSCLSATCCCCHSLTIYGACGCATAVVRERCHLAQAGLDHLGQST